MPIQQMLLGAGGEVDLPVEDIFKVTSFTLVACILRGFYTLSSQN